MIRRTTTTIRRNDEEEQDYKNDMRIMSKMLFMQ
jgi:hypothetical protein